MKFELFVAARYLRAKRRQAVIGVITIISVIGVAAGLASLVVALSINAGFQKDLQSQLLGSTSHVQLEKTLADGIYDWHTVLEKMSKQPHVMAAAPSLYEEVMINRAARAGGMELKGVIPEYENRVSELLKSVTIGSAAALAPKPSPTPCPATNEDCRLPDEMPPLVLGKDVEETMGDAVGSTVNSTSPQVELARYGLAPKFGYFKVVGVFRSGF